MIRHWWKKSRKTQMEKFTTLLDWKNEYSQNDNSTQGNLQSQCNPYQIIKDILHKTRTEYFKICIKHKRPWIAKAILKKKDENGGIKLPDFRQYYKATVTKMEWYWQKTRHMDQRNRTGSPEIHSHIYHQLLFDKGGKDT